MKPFTRTVSILDSGASWRTSYKDATPGVDDETVGGSAIKTPVNIQEVKTQGIELGLTYNLPETPFSGFLNGALTHAYGTGSSAAGF